MLKELNGRKSVTKQAKYALFRYVWMIHCIVSTVFDICSPCYTDSIQMAPFLQEEIYDKCEKMWFLSD